MPVSVMPQWWRTSQPRVSARSARSARGAASQHRSTVEMAPDGNPARCHARANSLTCNGEPTTARTPSRCAMSAMLSHPCSGDAERGRTPTRPAASPRRRPTLAGRSAGRSASSASPRCMNESSPCEKNVMVFSISSAVQKTRLGGPVLPEVSKVTARATSSCETQSSLRGASRRMSASMKGRRARS